MNSLMMKFETDPTVRARVVRFVSLGMAIAGAVAAVTVGFLSWVI